MSKDSSKRGAAKGAQTRQRILDAALTAFRENGFDQATMRDIAKRAGMSLGAAYYYFPSKEALVQAYYHHISALRIERVRATFAQTEDVRERLHAIYTVHLQTVGPDRRLLAALTRWVAVPDSDLSLFSDNMRPLRNRSIDLFYEALSVPEVPEHLRDIGALALWTLDLGLMMYLAWDDSPGQARSYALLGDVLDMLLPVLPLLSLPLAEPLLQQLARVLLDAGLVPDDAPDEDAPDEGDLGMADPGADTPGEPDEGRPDAPDEDAPDKDAPVSPGDSAANTPNEDAPDAAR